MRGDSFAIGNAQPNVRLTDAQLRILDTQRRVRAELNRMPSFLSLTLECALEYEAAQFFLADTLAIALGLSSGDELCRFHQSTLGSTTGKDERMFRLREPDTRRAFHEAFDRFVLQVVAPHTIQVEDSDAVLYYQVRHV